MGCEIELLEIQHILAFHRIICIEYITCSFPVIVINIPSSISFPAVILSAVLAFTPKECGYDNEQRSSNQVCHSEKYILPTEWTCRRENKAFRPPKSVGVVVVIDDKLVRLA
jgi:hypothetical protein